jgi:4-amino-4-deoxy-L-arabinose transferase-like glycosyltransferase
MKTSVLYRWFTRLPSWIDWIYIVVLIAAFVAIIMPLLGLNSLDFDEGFSAYLARFDPLAIAHYTALDVHPPLYYVILHYWGVVFGTSVPVLRLLSVMWSAIAILFGFLFVRRAFGRVSAWIAPLLLAVSPLFFHYTQIMRMYTMALAICMAATYVLLIISRTKAAQKRKTLWLVYALLVAAGMWTNYFTALVWATHLLWLLYEWRLRGIKTNRLLQTTVRSGWFKAVALAIVLYIPWLPALIYRYLQVQGSGFWIKPLSMDTLASTVTMATVYKSAANTTAWFVVAIVLIIVGAIIGSRRLLRSLPAAQRPAFRLLAACASLPIVLLCIMSLPPLQSSYVYRYVLTAIGIGALVMGVIFVKAPFALWKRTALVIIVLGLGVIGCAQAVKAGNQNLDVGQITMVGQAISDIYNTPDHAPILVRSAYNYYAAAAYEQPNKGKIYYIFNEQLGKIGSTRMLYDYPEARGVQDTNAFLRDHKRFWILSGDHTIANTTPDQGWHKGRSVTEYDPESGKAGTYAVEYYR